MEEKIIMWLKSKKLVIGFSLVVLSFMLGFYGKVLFIARFYEPFYLITGLSIFAFSWMLLFLGAFLVGRETVKTMQDRINQSVKKGVEDTYQYTKKLPKRGYDYTKELHKKGMDKITQIKNYRTKDKALK